jgi:hypothetical protein
MPITYQIDEARGLIRTRCVGHVVFAEVEAHFREVGNHDSLPDPLDVLLDLTALESVPESAQVSSVAREIEALQQSVRWHACVVVASSDLLFGMSRVLQAFAEGHFAHFNVTRDLEQAERWLASVRSTSTG